MKWPKFSRPKPKLCSRPKHKELEGLRLLEADWKLGQSYGALLELDAWEHLVGQLYRLRDAFVVDLVSGSGNLGEARATVKFIDTLLAVPDSMIGQGEASGRERRPLRGCRDQRRYLGSRTRLLHDDRR